MKCDSCKKQLIGEGKGVYICGLQLMLCNQCRLKVKKSKPEWDEVVEDTICIGKDEMSSDVYLNPKRNGTYLSVIFQKYLANRDSIPVRIKCRAGAILIERIGGKK